MQTIERKFLVKRLPNLSNISPIHYERYILSIKYGKERRIQRVGNQYELEEVEILANESVLSRNIVKRVISSKEFKELQKDSIGDINRDSYLISQDPNLTLKIYKGKYKGLIRVEVKFKSEEVARSFKSLDWLGEEITKSPLGRDSELVKLSQEDFKNLLNSFSRKEN